MNKVLIIGCPGAGKSTFARKLQEKINLPLYYLDRFYHRADTTNVSEEELENKIRETIAKDSWIIDGNYNRTLEMRIKECDTIFFLDIPVDLCIKHIENRTGKIRDDFPYIEKQFDPEFRQYVLDFPNDNLPYIKELLEKYKDTKNIITFKTNDEADKYIKKLS